MDQSGKATLGSRRAQVVLAVTVAGVIGVGVWFWAQDRAVPDGQGAGLAMDAPESPRLNVPPAANLVETPLAEGATPVQGLPEDAASLAEIAEADQPLPEALAALPAETPLAEGGAPVQGLPEDAASLAEIADADQPLLEARAALPAETPLAEGATPAQESPEVIAPLAEIVDPDQPLPEGQGALAGIAPESSQPDGDALPSAVIATPEASTANTPAPVFDLVRVDADGAGLVAGRAAPGAAVGVMLDGAELAEVRADPSGNFVAMFDVAPSDAARVLSLAARGDGAARASDSSVILAPRMAPAPDLAETVTAPDAPDLLVAGADGVRMLPRASDGPLGPDQVTMDVIAYDAEGGVAVAGRAASGGVVRVYIDNAPLVDADVAGDGHWQVELPEVASGDHTLRIDHLTEAGAVAARLETPFRREPPELLAALAPADGDAPVSRITVQPGNTLWGIARANYGAGMLYVKVFDANRAAIRDPDLIYPGQIFTLPE